jgi:FHA domain-containing protein
VTGIEKLLARIKALFEPNRPATPPSGVEEEVVAAAAVTEPAEPEAPAPVAIVEEPPSVEEIPAAAEQAPIVTEEAPIVTEEAPIVTEEAPIVTKEGPTVTEEAPTEIEPTAAAATPGGLTLRLESERGSRSTFQVAKSGATIGRGPESTIQLADLSVSRKHAKIIFRQGAYWLSDLGSMGGTWVDGTKLAAPRRVATGQTIDIGLCRLTVVSAGADEESPAARAPSHAARSH